MASVAPSKSFRRTTISALLLLWLSGTAWVVCHYLFPAHTDFGAAPNPLEPTLMKVHGAIAVFAVALLGWIGARHVTDNWSRSRSRVSGIAVLSTYILLVLSGYALYYLLQDELRERVGQVHEILGIASAAIALTHWLKRARPQPDQTVTRTRELGPED
jgi:succinate dehydrogenase hydrophobic anchor subunit